MTSRERLAPAQESPKERDRLSLEPCPSDVREVVLSRVETLRLRYQPHWVEGSFYRLRRRGEDGPPVKRFANRRGDLETLVHDLLKEGGSVSEPKTVVFYIQATPWSPGGAK